MAKIFFLTSRLPSFTPPLARNAGLLRELAPRHRITLAFFDQISNNESDLSEATRLCERVARLERPAAKGLSGLLRRGAALSQTIAQELRASQPDITLAEGEENVRLLRPALANLPASRFIILHPDLIERENGQKLPFGPGIDTEYFQRQTPVNITSKLFLFSIKAEDKRDGLICREALHYLLREVWPLVRERHPDATLKVFSATNPASFWDGARHGTGWSVEYGTISPSQYEAGRLALAPYLNIMPGELQPCLEAWAMQLPLLTLPAAAGTLEKLGGKLGDNFLKGEDGPSLAALMGRLLEIRRPGLHLAEVSRHLVEQRFSWSALATQFEQIVMSNE